MAFAELLTQLDSEPERKGRRFEQLCQWFLSNAPEYRGLLRRVWRWNEWSGRWGADAGIDLVAEDLDGRLWAIQAKAYASDYSIPKAEIDSFLSESSRPGFSYRLLIATTDRIGRNARRTLEGQRTPVGTILLSQLEGAQIEWPASLSELGPTAPATKAPRLHQEEAIASILRGFETRSRGQLLMACGSGKTLVAEWVDERMGNLRTLVLVPSLSLLAQTVREWTANSAASFPYLPVCSDPTVADKDEPVSHTSELGFPVTTSPGEIAAFLQSEGRRVIFSTYQSSPQVAEAQTLGAPPFDLVVCDEAHRCVGRVESYFTTALSDDKIAARQRLFMTATPRVFSARVRREAGETEVDLASMDDEKVFGPLLHHLSFGEAIGRGLLADYRVAVIGVSDKTYRDYVRHGRYLTLDGERVTDARTVASQIALAKAMRRFDLRRVFTFHGLIRRAREFSRTLPEVIAWMPAEERPTGELWGSFVTGEMSAGQRDVLLRRFREVADGNRGLLSNVRCLAEGVDVPNADGVGFIDPRRSTIDIIQAVGRAIRAAEGKDHGTILIPVFLAEGEDEEQILSSSSFRHVWDVLKALRAHDETLGDELDELRRELGQRGSTDRVPRRIVVELPESVGAEFAHAFDVRLVEQTTQSWPYWFGLLQRYAEREGTALAPQQHCEDGKRLGLWVGNQRTAYRRGELSEEHQQLLESLPGWVWEPHEAAWQEGFRYLNRLAEREGHSNVSASHVEDGYRLGQWVNVQRSQRNRGELDRERVHELEAVEGWTWDPLEDAWQEGFRNLERFIEHEGHSRVPQLHVQDGYPLGSWVATQREFYRAGRLASHRAELLETMQDWAWQLDDRPERWERGLQLLCRYVGREGHALVPKGYEQDDFPLGRWVRMQRALYSTGKLRDDRRQRLEELPHWAWNTTGAYWERGFAHLESYVEREGHARAPLAHEEDGFKLGGWVLRQRQAHKAGQLDSDRAERLRALPRWAWDTNEAAWERGFAHLLRFIQREGHPLVSLQHTEDGYPLGSWVNTQRASYRDGRLARDRAERLEALEGWVWHRKDSQWANALKLLHKFADREGHGDVPKDHKEEGFALGAWASQQRQRQERGTLAANRKRELDEVPDWYWMGDRWERNFRRLEGFAKREGHVRVAAKHHEGYFRLGAWVRNQRKAIKEGRLDPARRERLEALPGWSLSPQDEAWMAALERLLRFREREGHVRVPATHHDEDGFALGAWAAMQRTKFRKRQLAGSRVNRLNEVPGWSWSQSA